MAADYSRFRTPFYEIEIGDSQGKKMTPLPPQIARLVEKVEINETLCCNSFNQITLVFNEGSREPYSVEKGYFAPQEVYPSGSDGLLSNQSGMMVDLRMSSGGLTSAVPGEISTVLTNLPSLGTIEGLLGKDNTPPLPDVAVTTVAEPVDADIHYLLQQRNQVQVKWGYKESPDTIRIVRAYIMVVTSEFPESGTPKTTVVCHDSASAADQIVTNKGRRFSTKVTAGNDEDGILLHDSKDMPISAVLAEFCDSNDCIISDAFRAELYEQSRTKEWFAGESLNQFLTAMAKRHNAVYKFLIDHNTGNDVLVFISQEEWDANPIIGDESGLFTYRGNGSILKSVNIRADFGGPVGTFLQGINEEGGKVEREAPVVSKMFFDTENHQSNFPDAANPIKLIDKAKKAARGGVSGASQVSAETSPANMKDLAKNNTDKQGNNLVALDFNCLGFTLLAPGTLKFSGIGERYTGFYSVKTVDHMLDSNGYSCKGTAISFKNSKGGVDLSDELTLKGDSKVPLNQFQPENARGDFQKRIMPTDADWSNPPSGDGSFSESVPPLLL